MRNTKEIRSREDIIFETRPRFFMYLKSALIKFILILLIIYIFSLIRAAIATIQEYIISFIQIPLVEATTLILLFIIFILILWIIWDILRWRYTNYTLTDQRVIIQKGIIRKKKSFIHYDKIQDISVSQGLTERITSSGDIKIFGGHEHTNLILEDVPRPRDVEDTINRMIEGDFIFEKKKSKKTKPRAKSSVIKRHNEKFKKY
ncbi:PH domain-containing protein [Methanobacterium oryzae]|uniref:PH domain-containing protein n=1 Tax=Methanobacterium oryzae TaxID=69540 RepID=UPI003D1C6C88